MFKQTLMALAITGICATTSASAFDKEYLITKIDDLMFGKTFAAITHGGIAACSIIAAITELITTPDPAAAPTSGSSLALLAAIAGYTTWRAWANIDELYKLDDLAYLLEADGDYDDLSGVVYYYPVFIEND